MTPKPSSESPLFSIIMPTFNRAWILEKTLGKIVAQDYTNWELWIVDDGSTDETASVVKKFNQQDKRIQYFYQTNTGAAAARQKGLNYANGEWITYVDSDDEIYPYYLSKALNFFKTYPVVGFATAFMDRIIALHDVYHNELAAFPEPPTDKNPQKITLQDYFHWNIKPCGTGIFHQRELIKDIIFWDRSFSILEDLDFLMQLGTYYPEKFGYIPEQLFRYTQVFGADAVCSNSEYNDWADAFEKLYQKHKSAPLMEGQKWYPQKILKYRQKRRQYEKGELPPPWQRYFPDFFNKKYE